MKNPEASEKVLKAISIGLAAFIASSSPMTVLAQSDENHDQDTGSVTTDADKNANNTVSEEQRSDTEMLSAQGESQQETTSPVYPAGTNESHMSEHISNKAEEFNNVETSGAESVEAMQNSAADAEEAAKKAEEEAQAVQDDVDKLLGTEENKGLIEQLSEEVQNAENAVSEAENAVEDAKEAANEAEVAVSDAADALDGLESAQKEYNGITEENQEQIEENIEDAQQNAQVIQDQAQEAVQKAEEAKEQALTNLETALNVANDNASGAELTEEQKEKILSAVQKVQDAARTAEDAVTSAQEAVDAAEDEQQNTIREYNTMAMIYGLPLYQDLERDENGQIKYDEAGNPKGNITYTDDDLITAGCKEQHDQIQNLKNTHETKAEIIINTAIDSKIQAVEKAGTTFAAAQEAYDVAADNYQETLESADKVLQAAKEAAGNAEDLANQANDASNEALNYYVNKAQNETQVAKQAVIDKEQELAAAKTVESEKQSAYEEVKEQAIVEAKKQHTLDVEAAKYAYDLAESVAGEKKWDYERAKYAYETAQSNYKEYQKKNWWKPWEWGNSEEYKAFSAAQSAYEKAGHSYKESQNTMKEAYSAYEALNTQAAQDEYVNKAVEKSQETVEYQALIAAQNKVVTLNDEKDALEADYMVKSDELENRQKEVEKIRATYLKELEDTQAEFRDSLIQQVKDSIIDKSNIINQVEFDRALYAWAQDWTQYVCEHGESYTIGGFTYWFDSYGDDDAEVIREQINSKYPVSGDNWWNSLWNNIKDYVDDTKVLETLVSGSNHDEVMENWIHVYRESLQGLEEQKAIMESKIAALDAETSSEKAKEAVDTVTDEDGSLNVESLVNKAETTGMQEAKDKVEEEQIKLNGIKAQVQGYIALSKIDLAKLLNQIASAENVFQKTKAGLEEVKAYQTTVLRYAEYASKYAEYAKEKEQEPSLQKATGFAQITKDEQGNIIYNSSNEANFDEEDGKVISRPQSYFVAVSDEKSITVPESVYRNYLNAIVKHERDAKSGIEDKAGAGIAIKTNSTAGESILYWELDENNKMTGKYYTNADELKDGSRYFIAYSFKKENDLDARGYHLDGYIYKYTKQKETQKPGSVEGPIEWKQEQIQVNTTIIPENVPMTASIQETVPLVTIPEESVPLTSEVEDLGITIEDEDVALSDSVPKTGDNSIPADPFATTGVFAMAIAFLHKLFRKDRK